VAASDIQIKDGHIGNLTPDAENPRIHNPRNLSMIEESLLQAGAGRSVVADRKGRLINGNGVVEAAAAAGMEDAIYVYTNGTKLLVHVRTDLDLETDKQARLLSMLDNRSAELSKWDTDILAGLSDSNLLGKVFNEDELRRIISDTEPVAAGSSAAQPASSGNVAVVYRVIVNCDSEDEQRDLVDSLKEDGYTAYAETV
jgi:hypothetical protein